MFYHNIILHYIISYAIHYFVITICHKYHKVEILKDCHNGYPPMTVIVIVITLFNVVY